MSFMTAMAFQPGDGYGSKPGSAPYVGVTGFTSKSDMMVAINTYFLESERSSITSHDLMLGILLSHHAIKRDGEASRFPARYPPLDAIPDLVDAAKSAGGNHAVVALHYNTKNPYISDDVELIFDEIGRSSASLDAIQLNIAFIPDEQEIKKIKAKHRVKIIAQINGTIMRDRSLPYISSALSTIPVDHVLVDPSGGKGKDIDIGESIAVYKQLRSKTSACIGFAGGFGPDNVEEKVSEYVKKIGTTRFSVDAEGKMRDPSTDAMDVGKVSAYIRGFFRGISSRS
jgi:phosphoribosylanthranilate isomerase